MKGLRPWEHYKSIRISRHSPLYINSEHSSQMMDFLMLSIFDLVNLTTQIRGDARADLAVHVVEFYALYIDQCMFPDYIPPNICVNFIFILHQIILTTENTVNCLKNTDFIPHINAMTILHHCYCTRNRVMIDHFNSILPWLMWCGDGCPEMIFAIVKIQSCFARLSEWPAGPGAGARNNKKNTDTLSEANISTYTCWKTHP